MTDTHSIDELAKAAMAAQRKYTNTQGADLPMDEVRELRNIWLRALDAFRSSITPEAWLSPSSRIEALEGALKHFACGCEGACERLGPDTYAEPDDCCKAHDAIRALSTPKPEGVK